MRAVARAPGKVIMVGEHFVVYGEAAIVMAVNRHAQVSVEDGEDSSLHISSDLGVSGTFAGGKYEVEKGGAEGNKVLEPIKIAAQSVLDALKERRGLNIEVSSDIPMAAGLGSSGALAVATVAAVGRLLGTEFSEKEILALSLEAEKFVHVNPSGVDQAISTYGGIVVYRKGEGITRLKAESPIPLVIGNTGILRSTGRLVDSVRVRKNGFPEIVTTIIRAAGQLSQESVEALKANDLRRLGELMDINHGLLVAIGVSHEALDRLVYAAKKSGALGAKLTGAGGGGCMIALSTLERREEVSEAIRNAGGATIITEKADRGVHSWISG